MAAITVPLTVTPEAAARVAELGRQREFEQMLEHARQTIPNLRSLRVTLEPQYDTGEEDRVVIWATIPDPGGVYDPTEAQYGRWFVTTFPPEVCQHFVLLTPFELEEHGR
jgi:hypothetical protein